MRSHLGPALRLVLVFTLALGIGYPLAMTGLAQLLFPARANGSLVRWHGRLVGSLLIGQQFTAPGFFHGRPSATTPPYNAAASTPSNLGPTNPLLLRQVEANLAAVERENPGVGPHQIPPDLVESSGSGLDPDISPAAALLQVPRVARADHLPIATVRRLLTRHVRGRFLGIFGDPHVNVLALNLALLRLMAQRTPGGGAAAAVR
jgi:K+-transporting ATPase ATPase C chain